VQFSAKSGSLRISKIDDEPTFLQQAIEAVNRLFFLAMPIVVLCLIWPQIDRIEDKIEGVEKQVHATEKKVDAIEQKLINRVGEKAWQEIKSQLGR